MYINIYIYIYILAENPPYGRAFQLASAEGMDDFTQKYIFRKLHNNAALG